MDEPMVLVVYPGANGAGSIYQDDGLSFGYQQGDWMRILAEWNDGRRSLSLRLAEGSRVQSPMPRRMVVRVAGATPSREILFDGSPLEIEL